MALSAGTRLGPYEILEPLGAGGMGEVYRARDTRLKRDVALKVLPPELASEPERLDRFQREAETLAALNHPHIVTIFSVEEADDLRFLTMELIEGKTLTKVIPRGGLSLSHFFRIAIPLTEAVSAAHERGVIHRDLKPGNVMVTEEDRVKVLDFGLAKLREGVRGAVDTQSPTEPATGPGRVLGTAPYMSPEQVQGKPLDHRSDVFALGITLYEMATGERPFVGDTFADVASSILKDNPVSVTERKADLPRDLGKLIKHCLEKDPRKRFQTTLDLANELEELRREVDSGEALTSGGAAVVTSRAGGKRRVWLVSGAVVAALALAASSILLSRNAQPPPAPLEITPFTTDGGYKAFPQLSPDGEKVAYGWRGDIYVKALGPSTRPFRLTEHEALEAFPVWSPDSRQIAFRRDGALYTVPSMGGQERRLVDGASTGLSWSPDGEWIAMVEGPSNAPRRIARLRLATLEKEPLTSPPADSRLGDRYPAISPDGRWVAFVRSGPVGWADLDVWIQPVDGGEARQLTSRGYQSCRAPAWTAEGNSILFTAGPQDRWRTWRVRLDGGEPEPVLGMGIEAVFPSVRGRRMVFQQRTSQPMDLWRVPARPTSKSQQAPERLIASSTHDSNADYSPDGRRVAFASQRGGDHSNTWICDSDGSNPVQLTRFERGAGTPRWSPDGRRIVFDSDEAGDQDLWLVDADGGLPRRLTREPSADVMGTWSRDGDWVYFRSNRSGSEQVWKVPPDGGEAVQLTKGGGSYAVASWDGRFVYYSRTGSSRGIWRVPVAGGEETEVLPVPNLVGAGLAVSGRGLYYMTWQVSSLHGVANYSIHVLDLESGEVTEVFQEDGFIPWAFLAVSPGDEWLLYGRQPLPVSELMLLENFR